jgi:hypothetical protein
MAGDLDLFIKYQKSWSHFFVDLFMHYAAKRIDELGCIDDA